VATIQFSDDVSLLLRRGLAIALPGQRWRYARRTVRSKVEGAGRAVCGLVATQVMLTEIDRMGLATFRWNEEIGGHWTGAKKLGARERVGLMRLSIKLVALGPHDRCACDRCREHRKLMRKIS